MKSDKVEYIRFDDLKTGILMGDKPYILAHGDSTSLKEIRTPMGHIDLLEQLGEQLRYDTNTAGNAKEKWEAIKRCSDQIETLFIDLEKLPKDVGHLELFLNPSELALIPFELLLNKKGEPRFASSDEEQLVLTRNFRREKEIPVEIPQKPHILYVHTKPVHKNFLGLPFPDVPHKNHLQSLRYALRHWNTETQLTVLTNPTFEIFKNTVIEAQKTSNPFTHIHILAHGSMLFDPKRPQNFEYGIAFYSEQPLDVGYQATPAKEVKALFESLDTLPYLVNYMICDGANFTNGAKPDKNPVQATFEAGVPVVIGSQFPLSVPGSNLITKELYKRLLRGDDIRKVLGQIRTKLYGMEPADQHDWISMVTYANLPDDYDFQLLLLKLESQLAILNSIRDKASENDNDTEPNKDDFIRAKVQIEASIADLNAQLVEIEHQKSKEAAFLEGSGLLGSAYKRLAETEYKESLVLGTDTMIKQREHLSEAKKWYKKAANRNLSHHWSLIQYLSLCTVLDGKLSEADRDYWNTARLAAFNEIESNTAKDQKSVWPHGTLLELYLLTPNEKRDTVKKQVLDHTKSLVSNAKARGKTNALSSTEFQLMRYLEWWGSADFEIPDGLLAKDTEFLKVLLKQLNH